VDRIDVIVIGAGVVGLAVARAFALAGRSVIILERERQFGMGTSSRNSEVIHAGVYYPPGSLKERLCVRGRELLYAFCESHQVAHRRCGKLIVAHDTGERHMLDAIAVRAHGAGVELTRLDRAGAQALEPEVNCIEALLSPTTGIVDSHGYMLAMLGEAEDHGASIAYHAEAEAIERGADGWIVRVGETRVAASIVVNAAGLGAQAVAARTDALPADLIPRLHLAKGCYFTYSGKVPFNHLIYPVPVPGSLGTHLALDLAGGARFGPDIHWVDRLDYDVDPALKPRFVEAARKIWKAIDPDRLQPGYAGIRPKLSGEGEPVADFVIQGEAEHGLPGLVNLFGIESPGLTSSLAIAERVIAAAG
jgi:L-2-hydroxyglutarate oxidase LhgO